MNATLGRRVAWGLLGASIAMKLGAVGLVLAMPPDLRPADGLGFLVWTPGVLAFAVVGALIASRHPSNPVGWTFLGVGVAEPAFMLAEEYARLGTVVAPGSLPAAGVVGILGSAVSGSVLVAILLTGLLVPTGRLPSPRWRPVLTLVGGWFALLIAATLLSAGPISETLPAPNPLAAPDPLGPLAADLRSALDTVGGFLLLLTAPALILRWRRSEGMERAQLTWLVYAIVMLVVAVFIVLVVWEMGVLGPVTPALDVALELWLSVAVAGVPVAAGIAILRHRLYEIDVVIRRTLTYGALVAVLGGVYVGLVLVLQTALSRFTGGAMLPVALSTLAIAALFGPVRSRVRALVDRRFYRSRYDAQRTLEAFAGRLRDEVELEAVAGTLVAVANRAVRPASVDLWIRRRSA